jgi:hypothetical protein
MDLQGAGRAVKWGGSVGSQLGEDGMRWDGHHTADERYSITRLCLADSPAAEHAN